jgi:hypothetical protein
MSGQWRKGIARQRAQTAYRMGKVRAALEFKEKWAKNPEGMERRRKAGVRANAAAWAREREAWAGWWDRVKDQLTSEEAKALAASFLRRMRGKWRTRKHPRCVRSVLKRVAKLGVWRFDDCRGLYINPRMEAERQRERADRRAEEEHAEIRAEEMRRARAEAERLAAEKEARAKAAEEAKRAEDAKPAGAGWYQTIPDGDWPAVLAYLVHRRHLRPGQTLADTPSGLVRKWAKLGQPDSLAALARIYYAREVEVRQYAEALLCAD